MRASLLLVSALLIGAHPVVSADSLKVFDSADEAAFNALALANPLSIAENVELGGYIFRTAEGRYASTARLRGDHGRLNFPPPDQLVPGGGETVATWHTHGSAMPGVVSETFSPQDLKLNQRFGVDGYLATPSGQIKHYRLNNPDIRKFGQLP